MEIFLNFKDAFPVPGGFPAICFLKTQLRKPAKWPVSSPPKVNRLRSPESAVVDVWIANDQKINVN